MRSVSHQLFSLTTLGALLSACEPAPDAMSEDLGRSAAGPGRSRDSSAPTGTISLANGGTWATNLNPRFNLSAWDDVGVTHMCVSRGLTCSRWVPMNGQVNLPLANTTSGQRVQAWFRDAAGNVSAPAQLMVRVDKTPPTGGSLTGTASAGTTTLSWSGFSDATSGIASYRLVGRQGSIAPSCHSNAAILYEGTDTSHTIAGLPASEHAFKVCAFDAAGNMSPAASTRVVAQAETVAPTVNSFSIEDDATYVGNRTVGLSASLTDASGVSEYCASESATSAADCLVWRTWDADATFELSGGEGQKTVNAWFRDPYRNTSAMASDEVTFDRTPPENGVVIGGAALDTVSLSWSGYSDALSGVEGYVVVWAQDTAPADCETGTEVMRGPGTSLTLPGLAAARYAYRVCAYDGAGNLSSGDTVRVTVEPTPVPPVVTRFDTPDGSHVVTDREVDLVIQGTAAAEITRMCLVEGTTCSTWTPYEEETSIRVSAGDGPKTLSVWLRDIEGNVSRTAATLTVELIEDLCTTQPAESGIWVDGTCTTTFPSVSAWDVVEEWGTRTTPYAEYPSWTRIMATPAVGQLTDDDLDGDIDDEDMPDVVFTTFSQWYYHSNPGTLRIVSGDGSEVLASVQRVVDPVTGTAENIGPATGVALGDIDNDGLTDIVTVGQTHRVIALEGDGTPKWVSSSSIGGNFASPALADLDGDGDVEIIAGTQILDARGRTIATVATWGGGQGYAIDLDVDGVQEVVVGSGVYRPDGSRMWRGTAIGDGPSAVADFDGDGQGEVVVHAGSYMALYDTNGRLMWMTNLSDSGAGAPCVADFDGDGLPEVAAAGRGRMTMLEHDGSVKWWRTTQDNSSSVTGCSAFDFDADGIAEVVYADEIDLHLYEGPTGIEKWNQPDHASGTLYEYPLIADVDGDGSTEIIVPNNNYAFGGVDGLTVYGEQSDGWANSRQVWNQFGYYVGNIEDDLSVPSDPESPFAGHNSFRAQVPPAGPSAGAPDLLPHIWGVCERCSDNEVQLFVSIDNQGTVFAPRNTAIALYSVDEHGVETLVDVARTTRRVDPGVRSRSLRLDVPLALWGEGGLRVVVDDDGSGVGREHECDETNNELVVDDSPACE